MEFNILLFSSYHNFKMNNFDSFNWLKMSRIPIRIQIFCLLFLTCFIDLCIASPRPNNPIEDRSVWITLNNAMILLNGRNHIDGIYDGQFNLLNPLVRFVCLVFGVGCSAAMANHSVLYNETSFNKFIDKERPKAGNQNGINILILKCIAQHATIYVDSVCVMFDVQFCFVFILNKYFPIQCIQ